MSELSFEQMLEDSVKTIRNGEIVQGTVIDVKDDEIILNIVYKADGIITKNEYTNDSSVVLTDVVKPGDTMEAKVLKVNDGEGQVTLTYKRLAAEKGNKRLEEAFENQEVLKAPVTQVLDGGLCVNVEEARVFIPASLDLLADGKYIRWFCNVLSGDLRYMKKLNSRNARIFLPTIMCCLLNNICASILAQSE